MLPIAILAGGLATRLHPLTVTIPKAMVNICGEPFAHWQIKLLAKAGIRNIVYCVAYKSEMLEEFLGDGSRYGVHIQYSHDGPTQLGTGGAVIKALPLLGEKFMVLYGDSYLPIDYAKVAKIFLEGNNPALMTVYQNDNNLDISNVLFSDGQIEIYAKGENSSNLHHIDYGLSCFDSSVFSPYGRQAPVDLSVICAELSSSKLLAGFEVYDRFYEIGSFNGIRDFTEYIKGTKNDI